MVAISKKNFVILGEAKLGINLEENAASVDRYWVRDENDVLTAVNFTGTISGDYWQRTSGVLEVNSGGSSSATWERSAGILQPI